MSYPKIKELYENIDLNNDTAGYSGEKLSGGQKTNEVDNNKRSANPCKMFIWNEPHQSVR